MNERRKYRSLSSKRRAELVNLRTRITIVARERALIFIYNYRNGGIFDRNERNRTVNLTAANTSIGRTGNQWQRSINNSLPVNVSGRLCTNNRIISFNLALSLSFIAVYLAYTY